jgi:hypothetical protein
MPAKRRAMVSRFFMGVMGATGATVGMEYKNQIRQVMSFFSGHGCDVQRYPWSHVGPMRKPSPVWSKTVKWNADV